MFLIVFVCVAGIVLVTAYYLAGLEVLLLYKLRDPSGEKSLIEYWLGDYVVKYRAMLVVFAPVTLSVIGWRKLMTELHIYYMQ